MRHPSPKFLALALVAALMAGCEQTPAPNARPAATPYTKPTPTTDGRYPQRLEERAAEIEKKIDLMEGEMRRIERGMDASQKPAEERGRRSR